MKKTIPILTGLVVVGLVASFHASKIKATPIVLQPVQTQITQRVSSANDIYPTVKGATNPDITQANISQNICNKNWSTKSIRPPVSYTDKVKRDLMISQHLTGVKGDYELDHLISLEIGGSPTSLDNLWMEPYVTSIPDGGAKVKDSVENRLHKEVCSGSLLLSDAQHIVVTDWYAYYKSMK